MPRTNLLRQMLFQYIFYVNNNKTYFLEKPGNFTYKTAARFILKLTQVTVSKEEISKEWCMNKSLNNAIHEASVT